MCNLEECVGKVSIYILYFIEMYHFCVACVSDLTYKDYYLLSYIIVLVIIMVIHVLMLIHATTLINTTMVQFNQAFPHSFSFIHTYWYAHTYLINYLRFHMPMGVKTPFHPLMVYWGIYMYRGMMWVFHERSIKFYYYKFSIPTI